ncbi:hypothetical protein [Streptomyces sp. 147326]|uniref:hypothetical protein n=1 Tax=Streptomyces sp. 147326 TaxID=3074379 RepID=UPI0038571985
MDPELLERITARRAELDELEEQLAKQLAEVRAERDELAVAERVFERVSEQITDEHVSASSVPAQVGGRAVMLIPHRTSDVKENVLPPDYQRILAAVRQAAGPVMARQVGEMLGVDVNIRQAGTATRKAGQTRRPGLAAEATRRPVHHLPVTGCR